MRSRFSAERISLRPWHQRLSENALEVIQRQRQAHAEQHNTQHVTGVCLAPQAGSRHEVVEYGPHDNDDGEPFGQLIGESLDLLHDVSLLCLVK